MIKFDLNTDIYRPLEQVFTFVAMPENNFYWQYGTLTSARISNDVMGLGTLFRAVGHFMGERMESVYEVMEYEPNKTYGFKSLSGPIDSYTLYTFDLMKGRTRIRQSTQISLGAAFQSKPMTERTVKKEYRENLALLKDILEASQVHNPSNPAAFVSDPHRQDLR